MHVLNQHSMRLHLGSLKYAFEYTDYVTTDQFLLDCRNCIVKGIGGPATTYFDMPTLRRQVRTTSRWTLAHPLGKGIEGRAPSF